ncbi:MAG TPA: M23 family metallopeptidase [Candidatus Udaeobacter sp.]|nr:M23 family metallopeptidase [Candidatus Udaeobacter sp.]
MSRNNRAQVLLLVSFFLLNIFGQARADNKPVFKLPLPAGFAWRVHTMVGGKCGRKCYNRHHSDKKNGYYAIDLNPIVKSGNEITLVADGEEGMVDVLAAADGIIIEAVSAPCHNRGPICKVVIDHGNGYTTTYLHLAENSLAVEVGDKVRQGQVIAEMGNTGPSDGTHLHFQVSYKGGSRSNLSELKSITLEGIRLSDFQTGSFYISTNVSPQPL